MEEARKINICVSSWPGCGSTTLSVILALLFEKKYIYMGNIYRHLGQKLGYANEGGTRPKFDNYIEDIIGTTTDNYGDYVLLNEDNILFESDIAAFRVGKHPKIFSIFLVADKEERIKRVKLEGREDAENVLDARDKGLAEIYKKLWDIDFFDTDLIARKYNMKFDNSNMSLETELKLIINEIKEYHSMANMPESYWSDIYNNIQKYVDLYWKDGKQAILDKLAAKSLLIKAEETLLDIAKTFPEDVLQYPDNIKKYFLGNN